MNWTSSAVQGETQDIYFNFFSYYHKVGEAADVGEETENSC